MQDFSINNKVNNRKAKNSKLYLNDRRDSKGFCSIWEQVYVGAVLWPVVIIQQGELVATAVCMIDRKIGELLNTENLAILSIVKFL